MRIISLFILLFSFQSVMAALSIKQVAKGIYVHQGVVEVPNAHNHDEIANIGFIVGKQCVAVIDSGGNPKQGAMLRQAIKKITQIKICYVINTHVHPDHIFGNRAFENIPNIQFIGHKKLARAMAVRGSFYIARSKKQIGIQLSKQDIIPPTTEVKNTLRLDLGGRTLVLTAHPTAHTDNDLTVFDEATETMWLSDLLFISHLPVLDGSIKGWLAEIEQLEKRQFDVVIPGHGAIDRNWPEGMQAQKQYLQQLAEKLRLKIKQGIYLETVLKEIDRSAAQDWLLFNDFHKKNLSSAYAELEWED
ncbi:MAG: quinoprotein relay system zinc metallohydrolase 2 [Methyloprofundus sp.]|nr:quinoprotein relay system zinc metallohydrolase 2 [Methyloprofundus sp.]